MSPTAVFLPSSPFPSSSPPPLPPLPKVVLGRVDVHVTPPARLFDGRGGGRELSWVLVAALELLLTEGGGCLTGGSGEPIELCEGSASRGASGGAPSQEGFVEEGLVEEGLVACHSASNGFFVSMFDVAFADE